MPSRFSFPPGWCRKESSFEVNLGQLARDQSTRGLSGLLDDWAPVVAVTLVPALLLDGADDSGRLIKLPSTATQKPCRISPFAPVSWKVYPLVRNGYMYVHKMVRFVICRPANQPIRAVAKNTCSGCGYTYIKCVLLELLGVCGPQRHHCTIQHRSLVRLTICDRHALRETKVRHGPLGNPTRFLLCPATNDR